MNKWEFENLKDEIAKFNEFRLDELNEFIEHCQINLNHAKKFKVGDHVRVGMTRGLVKEINHGNITIEKTNWDKVDFDNGVLRTRTHSARFFEHVEEVR